MNIAFPILGGDQCCMSQTCENRVDSEKNNAIMQESLKTAVYTTMLKETAQIIL